MAIKGKLISGIKKLKDVKFFGNIKDKFKLKTKEEKSEVKITSLKDQLIELEDRLDNETNIFTRKRLTAKLDQIEQQLNRKVEEREIREAIKNESSLGWQVKQDEYDRLQKELDELVAQKDDLELELQSPYEALAKFEQKEMGKKENNSRMDELIKNRDKVLGNQSQVKNEEQSEEKTNENETVAVKNFNGEVIRLTKAEYQDWALGIEQEIEEIENAIVEKQEQLDETFDYLKDGFASEFKEKMETGMKPFKENIFKKLFNNTIGTWIKGFKDWRENRSESKKEIEEAKKQVVEKRDQELKDQELERKEARRKNLEKLGLFVQQNELENPEEEKDDKEEQIEKDENESR